METGVLKGSETMRIMVESLIGDARRLGTGRSPAISVGLAVLVVVIIITGMVMPEAGHGMM